MPLMLNIFSAFSHISDSTVCNGLWRTRIYFLIEHPRNIRFAVINTFHCSWVKVLILGSLNKNGYTEGCFALQLISPTYLCSTVCLLVIYCLWTIVFERLTNTPPGTVIRGVGTGGGERGGDHVPPLPPAQGRSNASDWNDSIIGTYDALSFGSFNPKSGRDTWP